MIEEKFLDPIFVAEKKRRERVKKLKRIFKDE